MNKVLSINLGGLPFTIDDDAYRSLENYLQSLHNHFRKSEGYEEIMNDIEARLAELLQEGMGKRGIVTTQDVKNAVSVMGKPEDFGAQSVGETSENASNTEGSKSTNATSDSTIRTGKHLFRDPDNKMIGGVCAGLAAYFGMKDATWLRIALVLLVFFAGTGAGLYLLLLIIIPQAKTTADKLAMRGEPIDVNSIAKSVETTVENLTHKVNEFGKPENQARFQGQVRDISEQIGSAFEGIFKVAGGVGRGVAIFVTIILVISLLASWVALGVGASLSAPMLNYVTDDGWRVNLAGFCAFILLAVPTVAVILFLRRLIYKRGIAEGWHIVMWSLFTACIFLLASLVGNFVKNFNFSSENSQRISMPNVETLTIGGTTEAADNIHIQFGNLKVSDEYLMDGEVNLHIEKSDDGNFELIKKATSEGESSEQARVLASRVEYNPSVSGDKLTLPRYFSIPKGAKWRGQSVQLTLKVPVGKTIKIDTHKHGEFIDYNLDIDEDKDEGDCYNEPIQIWQMTDKGFRCMNAKK